MHDPGFGLGICNDPTFGSAAGEESKLSTSSVDDAGLEANIPAVDEAMLWDDALTVTATILQLGFKELP